MDGSTNGHRPFHGDAFSEYRYEVKQVENSLDLSSKEVRLIEVLAAEGDVESRRRLIQMNLGYVMAIAKKYAYPGKLAAMDLLDLIQEGNIGLMQAAITYHSDQGSSFSNYAFLRVQWQIKSVLQRNLWKSGANRNLLTLHRRVIETTMALYEAFGREPTTAEIANHLQVDIAAIEEASRVMTIVTQGQYSLDATVAYRDDSRKVIDIVEDLNATDPIDSALRRSQQKELREVMNEILTPRERFLVAFYFNLADEKRRYNLTELADRLGISHERASQLTRKALEKLGTHPKVVAWYDKLNRHHQGIQTALTVFEIERREVERELRAIFTDWKSRTVLLDEKEPKKTAVWYKLARDNPSIRPALTAAVIARREEERERRAIHKDWKVRTVLLDEISD